jgi:hypothetical protein
VVLTNTSGVVTVIQAGTIINQLKHASTQIVHHHVNLEEYTNFDGIHINYVVSIVYVFHHHLCIPQESPDDGLSGPKHMN